MDSSPGVLVDPKPSRWLGGRSPYIVPLADEELNGAVRFAQRTPRFWGFHYPVRGRWALEVLLDKARQWRGKDAFR